MNQYLEQTNPMIKEYFKILSPEGIPEFLWDYINTPEMQKQNGISVSCGTIYSKMYNQIWYSSLDHSIAVALIVWNFTKDKKQTLAGLFHDIATPVFKHTIDFMNGDYETQESTEELTTSIIENSQEIMSLLNRDNIKVEEIDDYHIYPIADNDTPQLAADRLEYTLSNGLGVTEKLWGLDEVKEIYQNIEIQKNEDGLDELAFKDKSKCEDYIHIISKLWPHWVNDEDRTVMQFFADICRSMNTAGYLTISDLYSLSEKEIINKILNCKDSYLSNAFKEFQKQTRAYKSEKPVENKYCVKVTGKTRYVNPLVVTKSGEKRISKLSSQANAEINEYLRFPKGGYYTYFDFNFKPYTK